MTILRQFTTIYDIFCPVPFLPSPCGFRRIMYAPPHTSLTPFLARRSFSGRGGGGLYFEAKKIATYFEAKKDYLLNLYSRRIILGNSMCFLCVRNGIFRGGGGGVANLAPYVGRTREGVVLLERHALRIFSLTCFHASFLLSAPSGGHLPPFSGHLFRTVPPLEKCSVL